jgi:hypothetical protein
MKRPSLTIRSKVRRDTPIAAATASTRMSWLMVILYVVVCVSHHVRHDRMITPIFECCNGMK